MGTKAMQDTFSVIACGLYILAFLPYLLAIRRGDTKPVKITWIIWATVDSIALAGMLFKQAPAGQMIGAVTGVWVVVAFALKYGERGWTWRDGISATGAVLGISLWAIFSSPLVGLLISLSIILWAFWPIVKKTWRDPASEDKWAWSFWWLSCLFMLAAVPKWTLANGAQPVVFMAIESVACIIIYFKPRKPIAA